MFLPPKLCTVKMMEIIKKVGHASSATYRFIKQYQCYAGLYAVILALYTAL